MTQRTRSPAPLLDAWLIESPARRAISRTCRGGYIAICLLAIGAAIVIARGGAPNAEWGFASVLIEADAVIHATCAATGDPHSRAAEQACLHSKQHRPSETGAC